MDDLRLLRALREVAVRRSFSEAAEALGYTQPAISQQLARLERQAGVKLLEREPGGVQLTEAGELLVARAETVLAEIDAARAELEDLSTEARGRLRVGAFSSATASLVPPALSAVRRERGRLDISLEIVDPPRAVPGVKRGEFDVAIAEFGGFTPQQDVRGLHVEHLFDDEILVALPPAHRMATRRSVALKDLTDEDWLLLVAQPGSDDNVVHRAFREAGVKPRVHVESLDHFALMGLVASGMGVSLMPKLIFASSPRNDLVLRSARPRITRQIVAITGEDPAGAVAAMLDALKDAAARL